MRWWWIYAIVLLIAWTIPFDPVLNTTGVLVPSFIILGIIGLVAIDYASMPHHGGEPK